MFLRLNGWKLQVEAQAAHTHLTGLLDRRECDYVQLLAWIRDVIVPLR